MEWTHQEPQQLIGASPTDFVETQGHDLMICPWGRMKCAKNDVPDRKYSTEIAISLWLPSRMVNPMQIGSDNEVSKEPIYSSGQPKVGVRPQCDADVEELVQHEHPRGQADDDNKRDTNTEVDDELYWVKPHRRGYVHLGIQVVNAMDAPEHRDFVH